MKARKLNMLIDYLLVDDKVTLKQEKLMGFPVGPKEVERLAYEAMKEVEELKRDSESYNSPETQRKLKLAEMIEWAVENGVKFVECEVCNKHSSLVDVDFGVLQKIYAERCVD